MMERLRFWLRKTWRRFCRWTVASPIPAFILGAIVGTVAVLVAVR